MENALEALRHVSGCDIHTTRITFANGTKGNMTTCVGYHVGHTCPANMTYCVSDGGHRWYGSTYDQYHLCLWMGYTEKQCDPVSDLHTYGPNTMSISVANQLLDFFDAHTRGPPVTPPPLPGRDAKDTVSVA